MSFLDLTGLISSDQLEGLRELNLERAASGQQLITLLDVIADDTILESTGVTTTSAEAEATLNAMSAINDAAAGLAATDRFTGQDTNEIIRDLVQENIDAGGTFNAANVIDTYVDDQANATVELSGGELDLSDLPDYGRGSIVLAPDGKGVIRGGNYISLDPTQSSMSGSEVNDLKAQATRNTNLLLAQQELEENGTPIAETLGLKQPGDDNFDRDDRERIQEAENAAANLVSQFTDIDQYRYEQKQNESGPSAIEIHNQIFGGGGNAPGTVKQDENGNWYAVKQLDNSNALGRDYSIDPKDNSAGPTFGANVSKDIEEMFPNEVAAAGGSSDFEGSIKDIFKDTDVDSLGYDPVTGTYSRPEPVVTAPVETDIAQPGDLDIPEVTTEMLDGTPVLTMEEIEKLATEAIDTAPDLTFTPVGGPGTFTPGSLPAAPIESVISTGGPGTFTPGSLPAGDPDALDPRGDQIVSPTGTGIGTSTTPVGANDTTEALLNLVDGIASGDVGLAEADATSKLLEGEDLTDDDITALMPPSTGGDETVGGFTEAGLAEEVAKYTGDAKVVDLAASVLNDLGSEVGQTTTEDAIEALKARIGSPYDTNVSAAEVAATLGLIQGTPITSNELDALMPEYNFFKPDSGTQLLLEGSGALTTKMLGNFVSAMENIGGLPSLGFTGVQEFGEDLRAQGEAAQLEVLGKLQTEAPDTFDALNRPIMGDEGFDFEALAAKGYYSSIPTILGLSGIPFGVTAALVTGGIMTGAEVGTEARDDTYNTAVEMGYSVAEAETLSRSASTLATAFGMPIGALSNVLFSTVLPGSGAGSIATIAGNIAEEAVTEGYIEQNAAAGAVDLVLGTDKFGKAYSIDEGIVGALVGGGVTIATINNAINKSIESPAPPGGETSAGGEASTGGPSATDLATASEILNSGADVSIVTDSNGDLIITDTGTGQSVNVGSVISSSVPISGSETTAADLTAAEQSVVSGASDVTIVATGGNITLTNNQTGFTAVLPSRSSNDSTSIMEVVTAVENNDSTGVTNAGATISTGSETAGGISTLVPGTTDTTGTNTGVTTTAGADSTTTTVGVGSTETITSGNTQITTSVDANGNTTVMTTNTNTGVGETTTVPAGSNTTISSGVTEITVNATNTGTTTTAVTNTGTNVPAAVTETATNVPAAVTNTTDVGTLTTFTEEDDDFTSDTTFTPTTEFTPTDDDTTEDPVGEQDPGYTSGIAGLSGARPTVAPYYQPQQTGQYSFYVPQPGVDQTVPAGPVMSDPTSYLAPTANPQYGYGYIAPNAELEYLRRLAEIQGTGAEKLPSENLMDGS